MNCIALEPQQILELPPSEVERALPSSQPMVYYLYAARLAHEGDKERALFWYYVGELRYRFYLAANPDLSPDGVPALYGSLHRSVGQAVADPKQIDRSMSVAEFKRALDWDATNDNKITSKKVHHKAWLKVRANLADDLGMQGGYVAWHRGADGTYRIIREEESFIDKGTIAKMNQSDVKALAAKFGCITAQ